MIRLCGYALPFDEAERNGTRVEFVPTDSDLTLPSDSFLNFGDHDAPAISQVALFADDYGIGFETKIDDATWRAIKPYVVTNFTRCSVEIAGERGEWAKQPDGGQFWCVTSGRISHVTIVADDRAIYGGTGIWLAPEHVIGALPPRVAGLADRWEAGRSSSARRADARQWAAAEMRKRRQARAALGDIPSAAARMLAARRADHDTFRAQVLVAAGAVPLILGHVAFSRAAGFGRRPGER